MEPSGAKSDEMNNDVMPRKRRMLEGMPSGQIGSGIYPRIEPKPLVYHKKTIFPSQMTDTGPTVLFNIKTGDL